MKISDPPTYYKSKFHSLCQLITIGPNLKSLWMNEYTLIGLKQQSRNSENPGIGISDDVNDAIRWWYYHIW